MREERLKKDYPMRRRRRMRRGSPWSKFKGTNLDFSSSLPTDVFFSLAFQRVKGKSFFFFSNSLFCKKKKKSKKKAQCFWTFPKVLPFAEKGESFRLLFLHLSLVSVLRTAEAAFQLHFTFHQHVLSRLALIYFSVNLQYAVGCA